MARFAIPLAAYYAVTLALPLANGAAAADGFVRHAISVLVLPIVIAAAWWTLIRWLRRAGRQGSCGVSVIR